MMDPAQISQEVNPAVNTACLDARSRIQSTTPADRESKVLDDDDLLIEIMVRLGFPTSLVRAALVCKRWFRHASDMAFLHRFRKLHPPRLLGFYVHATRSHLNPICFVPMLPQPPEPNSVIQRASFSLDTPSNGHTSIDDCRNGSISIRLARYGSRSTIVVHSPLFPERSMAIVPPFPHCTRCHLLLKEGAGLSSSYVLAVSATGNTKSKVDIYLLKDGVWFLRNWATIGVPCEQLQEPLLVDNKIYILTSMSGILVFDVMASNFYKIQLLQGVVSGKHSFAIHPLGLQCDGRTMLSRADDSGVHLIHLDKLQLGIWLHKKDRWLMVDRICLHEMCTALKMSDCALKDEHMGFVEITKVGDGAEFVLLMTPRCLFHWDVKCRTMRKVFEAATMGYGLYDAYPFMMIWPPTFPTLNDDTASDSM